jgi:hypothetical protein
MLIFNALPSTSRGEHNLEALMRSNLIFVGIVVGVLALGAGLAWALFAVAHSPSSANRSAPPDVTRTAPPASTTR